MRAWTPFVLVLAIACGDKTTDDAPTDGATTPPADTGPDDDGGDDGTTDPDADGDGSPASEDCDDANPDVYPFADEYCDGVDNDCDGDTDENTALDAVRYFTDADDDGYGSDDNAAYACDPPADATTDGGDCDDDDPDQHPGADELCNGVDDDCDDEVDEVGAVDGDAWYTDADGDGYGDDGSEQRACLPIPDTISTPGDCDDADPAVNPDATEVCGGGDEDCDGQIDDADPSVDPASTSVFYADTDTDGYGDASAVTFACAPPTGFVADATDCDDGDASTHPGATEVCGGGDEDCDGLVNDDDPSVDTATAGTWYADADEDGYGDAAISTTSCSDPSTATSTWSAVDTDCDDVLAHVNPGATEVCDADDTDEDCSGTADDADATVDTRTFTEWYLDADADGYGLASSSVSACDAPSGYSARDGDCDDTDSGVSPGATEVCDPADTDEDCDGLADDADPGVDPSTLTAYHPDADGDGYGDTDTTVTVCDDPSDASLTYTTDDSDCEDGVASVHPGATELCDAYDNDCDPTTTASGVAFTDSAGTSTSVTSTYSAGTASSPTSATLSSNGTLSFCGGTWYVQFSVEADVTVSGTDGAVLDGGGTAPVFELSGSGRDLTVTGLTVQDGYGKTITTSGTWGGTYTSYRGGGIYCSDSSSSVTISDSVFDDNAAQYGGAVYSQECAVSVEGSQFTDNSAVHYGGALYLDAVATTVTLDGVTIDGNSADAGGGVYLDDYTDLTVTDSVFSNNTAADNGGALYVDAGGVDATDSTFEDNTAGDAGGGWFLNNYTSSGTTYWATCTETASGTGGFFGNTASGGAYEGGAVTVNGYVGFASYGCDFGTGTDDNSPADIHTSAFDIFDYGDDETFSCLRYSGCL